MQADVKKIGVLFVCLGNICRSPSAHGVFRHLVSARGLDGQVHCDSAGTGDWHVGNSPDARATAEALKRGYDISDLRARRVCEEDFSRFDYLLAMDSSNLNNLRALCPDDASPHIELFLRYATHIDANHTLEVPDPYYRGDEGFSAVLSLVEDASAGLLDALIERHPQLMTP